MTKILTAITVLSLSYSAFAAPSSLDGRSYCRTVKTNGTFGQPKGERKHCLSFKAGQVRDGANTFFGKPPESSPYKISGNQVTANSSKYVLSEDGKQLRTVRGSTVAGTIFTLKDQAQ